MALRFFSLRVRSRHGPSIHNTKPVPVARLSNPLWQLISPYRRSPASRAKAYWASVDAQAEPGATGSRSHDLQLATASFARPHPAQSSLPAGSPHEVWDTRGAILRAGFHPRFTAGHGPHFSLSHQGTARWAAASTSSTGRSMPGLAGPDWRPQNLTRQPQARRLKMSSGSILCYFQLWPRPKKTTQPTRGEFRDAENR